MVVEINTDELIITFDEKTNENNILGILIPKENEPGLIGYEINQDKYSGKLILKIENVDASKNKKYQFTTLVGTLKEIK